MSQEIVLLIITLLIGGTGGGFLGWILNGRARQADAKNIETTAEINEASAEKIRGESYSSLIAQLRMQIDSLKALVDMRDIRIGDLERQVAELSGQVKAVEAKMGLEKQVSDLTAKLCAMQERLDAYEPSSKRRVTKPLSRD